MIGIKIISLRTPLVSNDFLCRRYSGINFFSIWYQILTRAIDSISPGHSLCLCKKHRAAGYQGASEHTSTDG